MRVIYKGVKPKNNAVDVAAVLSVLGVDGPWPSLPLLLGDLHLDSRLIQAGDVFLAVPGLSADGRHFIAQALQQGAALILQEGASCQWQQHGQSFVLSVPHLTSRLGELAAAYYQYPADDLHLHAITGTNGKTSCSHFLAQALTLLGHKAAVIGTLGVGLPGALLPLANTTPDAVTLQRSLAHLRRQGVTHVALEASSIALVQDRLQACRLESAIFTNLTRDHLDYHGDMHQYGAAKALLFAHPHLQRLVVNQADPFSATCVAAKVADAAVYPYACHAALDSAFTGLQACLLKAPFWGLQALWAYRGQQQRVDSPLLAAFNMENLLATASVLLGLGVEFKQLPSLIARIKAVPGRLQTLGGGDRPWVVVDYAHTPDALAQVLSCLRPYTQATLWCIVGCGGDRDRGKRPLIAAIAGQQADKTVLTDDNPRFESSQEILMEMVTGFPKQAEYVIINDRRAAILHVMRQAKAGDVVLIAGKGHETYQQIGATRHPFDDVAVASAALM